MLTNYELEQANYKRQPTVRMKINNDEYEADVVRKMATRRRLGIELNSIDLKGEIILVINKLVVSWRRMSVSVEDTD